MINNVENKKLTIEQLVLEKIKKKIITQENKDKFWTLKVKQIWKNVFELVTEETNNIEWFNNINWEVILNITAVIEDHFFNEALILSWLYFFKEKNSPTDHLHILKYNWKNVYDLDAKTLLKLVEQVQDNKNKKNKLKWLSKWKEIDKFSYEYFKAWQNISFFEDRLILKAIQKTILLWSLKWELDKHNIKWFFDRTNKERPNYFLDFKLEDWTLLIKDIDFFANHQMLSKDKKKNEDLKQYYIKNISKIWFLKQIMDEKFFKTWDQITKNQVENYYKKWYLPEKIYKQAINILEEIEQADTKLDKKKEEEQKKELSPHAKELRDFFKSVWVDLE